MNDKNRLRLLQRGDERALEKIILTYTNYVGAVIANTLGTLADTATVEELASDVFFCLWKNCRTIKTENLKGWLGAAARNKAKNYIRSKHIIYDELPEDAVICSEDNVFDRLLADEQKRVIDGALRQLEDEEREIIVRYYYFDSSVKQIADEMNIKYETAKSKLQRGRKKLKDIFDKGGYFK